MHQGCDICVMRTVTESCADHLRLRSHGHVSHANPGHTAQVQNLPLQAVAPVADVVSPVPQALQLVTVALAPTVPVYCPASQAVHVPDLL